MEVKLRRSFFVFAIITFSICRAQERPKYTTAPFDTSVSHRQSVCDRQERFNLRNVTLRDALQGFELHPWLPVGQFSPLDPDTGAIIQDSPGFTVEILDELAIRAGFSWRTSFGVSSVAQIGNQTMDDLLQWTVQTYDLSVASWSRIVKRIEAGIVFPEGVYDSSIIMVGIQETDSKINIWSFLEPFEWGVWVMILVSQNRSSTQMCVRSFLRYLLTLHLSIRSQTRKNSLRLSLLGWFTCGWSGSMMIRIT
jgi:hypothetical protein